MPISKEAAKEKRKRNDPWICDLYNMNCDQYRAWIDVSHHVLRQQTLQDVIEIIENENTPIEKFSRSRTIWNDLDPWVRHLAYENRALLMNPTCTQLRFNYSKFTYVFFRKPSSKKGDIIITTHIERLKVGTKLPTPKYNLLLPHK